MNAKTHKLIQSLDYRIDAIRKSKSDLESALTGDKKTKRKAYYFDVACFVHTIKESYELNMLFDELLSYSANLPLNPEYAKTLKSIHTVIRKISQTIMADPDFSNFEKEVAGIDWFNPFTGLPFLKIRELLVRLQNIKDKQLTASYHEIQSFFLDASGLNGVFNRWKSYSPHTITKIQPEFATIQQGSRMLDFHEKFLHDFHGVNAAISIHFLYKNVHPLFVPTEINAAIVKGLIRDGDDTAEAKNHLENCLKIRNFLEQKLSTRYSINSAIKRFTHYMEVFYVETTTKNPEKTFQKEFELFMFNNGYFALSEGNLGNGRFDNIVLNAENAFLCEHKQIGLGTDSPSVSLKKFISAKIQAKIYHQRLFQLPGLANEIHILVFTKNLHGFKNGATEVQRNGITFRFHTIYLGKQKPSAVKNSTEIDLEEIIKE